LRARATSTVNRSRQPTHRYLEATEASAHRGAALTKQLLAEGKEVIREMAQIGLEAKGYRVLSAPDGASALSMYRGRQKDIDLVIADMVMPRMSGSELFAHMKEINPAVRVIVSSDYSHDQEGQRILRHSCLGYLQKPYNIESLNHLVRPVLDSGL
jgi:CheY-like chemotaxis protein